MSVEMRVSHLSGDKETKDTDKRLQLSTKSCRREGKQVKVYWTCDLSLISLSIEIQCHNRVVGDQRLSGKGRVNGREKRLGSGVEGHE